MVTLLNNLLTPQKNTIKMVLGHRPTVKVLTAVTVTSAPLPNIPLFPNFLMVLPKMLKLTTRHVTLHSTIVVMFAKKPVKTSKINASFTPPSIP